MANEITFTFSLTAYKPSIMSSAVGRSVTGRQVNMAGVAMTEGTLVANHLSSGSGAANTIIGATNASPILITTQGNHGLATGEQASISGCQGNTAPNGGPWIVSVISATTFTIPTAGNGTYTSGGVWATTIVALPLGIVVQPHWLWIANLDPVNVALLRMRGSDLDCCDFYPGEAAWVPVNPLGAPLVSATPAAAAIEYLMLSL